MILDASLLLAALIIVIGYGVLPERRHRRRHQEQRQLSEREVALNGRPYPGGFQGASPSRAPIPGPDDTE